MAAAGEREVVGLVASSLEAAAMEEENAGLRRQLGRAARGLDAVLEALEAGDAARARRGAEGVRREVSAAPAAPPSAARSAASSLNAQLQVKVELEAERRVRLQGALDDAERRAFTAGRDAERSRAEEELAKQKLEAAKAEFETQLLHLSRKNDRLHRLITEKEHKILESESLARGLTAKAEQFEEAFQGQLESVRRLQADLGTAAGENRALVKEMEALNDMFQELERTHVDGALKDYCQSEDVVDLGARDGKGQVIGVQELFRAVQEQSSCIQDSCFKEVTTKNGTRMVLSVSKTFMKLRDLIVEKKTLEDQVEKMNAINTKLADKVNAHEAKLYNVTDELNKTWNYVSTIKLQHRRLHTSEQVLRAELFEKRQLLTRLRQELEFSRQNWMLVKQKTADSEREWKALRDEFRARRMGAAGGGSKDEGAASSSESGFSDSNQTEGEEEATAPKEEAGGRERGKDGGEKEAATVVVAVPPMSFLAEVPDQHLPPLLPGGGEEAKSTEEGEDSYQDIYNRLMQSTERSAQIVSRLASFHQGGTDDNSGADEEDEDVEPRTEDDDELAEIDSPDILSIDESVQADAEQSEQHEDEDDVDNEDADSETSSTASQSSEVSLDESLEAPFPEDYEARLGELTDDDDDTDESSSLRSASSPEPAFWDDGEEEEEEGEEPSPVSGAALPPPQGTARGPTPSSSIPTPPPPPTFSLLPPPPTISVRPTYNYANVDSQDSDSDSDLEEGGGRDTTAVTRFLIKHLPKQMSKLRNDKAELEDKIRDLEDRISNQNTAMAELERRAEVYKSEAAQAKESALGLQQQLRLPEHSLAATGGSASSPSLPLNLSAAEGPKQVKLQLQANGKLVLTILARPEGPSSPVPCQALAAPDAGGTINGLTFDALGDGTIYELSLGPVGEEIKGKPT